jgi:hypothetical protein
MQQYAPFPPAPLLAGRMTVKPQLVHLLPVGVS